MDNWVAIPLTTFLHQYGAHASLDIYVMPAAAAK
jgi:hypothetical protein